MDMQKMLSQKEKIMTQEIVTTKKKVKKHPGGRPSVMDKIVLAKLEDAFSISATDEQAAFYAGVSVDALYDYQKKHPEFAKRKQLLKESVGLRARRTVVQDIETNPGSAWKWLEKKYPEEFGDKGNDSGLLASQFDIFLKTDGAVQISEKTLKLMKPNNPNNLNNLDGDTPTTI